MRHFFRGQFTDEARDNFRERQGKLGKKSVWWARRSSRRFRSECEPTGGALEAGDTACAGERDAATAD